MTKAYLVVFLESGVVQLEAPITGYRWGEPQFSQVDIPQEVKDAWAAGEKVIAQIEFMEDEE